MSDFISLGLREALFLAIVTAIGVGPATFLPPRFSRWSRVALAPLLGLSVAVCVFTTLEWYIDGNTARWAIPPLIVASLAVGHFRHRANVRSNAQTESNLSPPARRREMLSALRGVLGLVVVCIAVSFPTMWMLASQHSIGPTAYEVYDAPGYVATADGAQILSIGAADHTQPPVASFVLEHWINQVQTNNRLDITPVAAAINALVELHGTQTWAAYLLAVLVIGGLALYASISVAIGRLSFFAVLGASLFGTTFFVQLFTDGSQAAIVGLALVVPLLILVRENVLHPHPSTFAISALLLAALATVYPVFFLPLLATTLLSIAWFAAQRNRWNIRASIRSFLISAGYLCGVLLLAGAFDVVATVRDVPSWITIVGGGGASTGQPAYHLGFGVVTSWLLQLRDFYTTAFGPQSLFFDVVPTLLLPLAIIAVVVLGLRRTKEAWIPLLFVALCCFGATKQIALDSCAYCEDRTLLPIAPVAIFILFSALAVLFYGTSRRKQFTLFSATALYLGFVGLSLNHEQESFETTGYFLPDSIRQAIAAVPPTNKPVELDGFGIALYPSVLAEEALPYEALLESAPHGMSFLDNEPEHGVANTLGSAVFLISNTYDPHYQYVLTRVPQIQTSRTLVWQSNGVALEKRKGPLDVTIESGLVGLLQPSAASTVAGWVNGPMTFVVAGPVRRSEHLKLQFVLPSSSTPITRKRGDHLRRRGVIVNACIAVTGSGDVGTAAIDAMPANVGIVLRSMAATYGTCAS